MDLKVVITLLVVILAGAAWFYLQRRKSENLRKQFGPEYDTAVNFHGDKSRAETELKRRAERVERFRIRPLPEQAREEFAEAWRRNQAHFVDDPAASITEADNLVCDVMKARGYPMADFERRAADLSVDHPHVVRNYRSAHEIALRHSTGQAGTEELRHAMVYYRDLFAELLQPHREEVHR